MKLGFFFERRSGFCSRKAVFFSPRRRRIGQIAGGWCGARNSIFTRNNNSVIFYKKMAGKYLGKRAVGCKNSGWLLRQGLRNRFIILPSISRNRLSISLRNACRCRSARWKRLFISFRDSVNRRSISAVSLASVADVVSFQQNWVLWKWHFADVLLDI